MVHMACRLEFWKDAFNFEILVIGKQKKKDSTVKAPGTETSTTFLSFHSSVDSGTADKVGFDKCVVSEEREKNSLRIPQAFCSGIHMLITDWFFGRFVREFTYGVCKGRGVRNIRETTLWNRVANFDHIFRERMYRGQARALVLPVYFDSIPIKQGNQNSSLL